MGHLGWEGNTKLEGKLSGLETLSSTTNSKHMGEGGIPTQACLYERTKTIAAWNVHTRSGD